MNIRTRIERGIRMAFEDPPPRDLAAFLYVYFTPGRGSRQFSIVARTHEEAERTALEIGRRLGRPCVPVYQSTRLVGVTTHALAARPEEPPCRT